MGSKSQIEWTDATWNPVNGCERVSPGCQHCYAERFASRFSKPGERYHGLVTIANGHPQWTGKMVTAGYDEDSVLWKPCRWRKPRMIFVNSMSDLFHDDVPFEFIDAVMAVVALSARHTFQVLTKRPARMAEYFRRFEGKSPADVLSSAEEPESGAIFTDEAACHVANSINGVLGERLNVGWPMRNLWLGVSVEDQKRADERIPLLLQTPAAVRWISAEPLLGPIDLLRITHPVKGACPLTGIYGKRGNGPYCTDQFLNWVVVGGESGPGARPMDEAWARSLVQQCKAANVPVFVKQMGAVPMEPEELWRGRVRTRLLSATNRNRVPDGFVPLKYGDSKGKNIEEFPEDLRIREYPAQ